MCKDDDIQNRSTSDKHCNNLWKLWKIASKTIKLEWKNINEVISIYNQHSINIIANNFIDCDINRQQIQLAFNTDINNNAACLLTDTGFQLNIIESTMPSTMLHTPHLHQTENTRSIIWKKVGQESLKYVKNDDTQNISTLNQHYINIVLENVIVL